MTTADPLEALELVNGDYNEILNSREYRIGRRLLKLKQALGSIDVKALAGFARSLSVQSKVRGIGGISGSHPALAVDERAISSVRESSSTVYTCVTNGYDLPHAPLYSPAGLESVLFVDGVTSELMQDDGGFVIRRVENEASLVSSGNPNRYCKMHPGEFFDSDFTIYTDGSVQVVCDLADWCAIARASETGVAMHAHSSRECAYDEACACIASKRGNSDAILRQMERYEGEGFPRRFGMREATVIVSDLRNPLASNLLAAWWEEYVASGSGRDQLALPYVLWKMGLTIDSVACLGPDVWKSPKLRFYGLGSHSFK